MSNEKAKNIFLVDLGSEIARIRQERGLNQTDLAYKCEKDRQSIHRLEKGKINPSIYYLHEICEALDISLSELLSFRGNKRK